jgi:hypothetical protein
MTLRWRKRDSNPRSHLKEQPAELHLFDLRCSPEHCSGAARRSRGHAPDEVGPRVRIRFAPAASHERTCVVAMPAVPAVFDTGSSGGICPGNSQGLQSRSVQRLCGIALTRKGRSENDFMARPSRQLPRAILFDLDARRGFIPILWGNHESSCLVNCAMQRARSGMCDEQMDFSAPIRMASVTGQAASSSQSHSIPDNVMALFGLIGAWNYSAETARSAVGGSPSSLKASLSKSNSCRPAGASRIAR